MKEGVPEQWIASGRALFEEADCEICHGGDKWTISTKDSVSQPNLTDILTETNPPPQFGNPVGAQYLDRFLEDISSFNIGARGEGNLIDNNVGAREVVSPAVVNGQLVFPDALGIDYNNDHAGNGFNVPSLLGIHAVPTYLHNGACETLKCVLNDVEHRTANGTLPDRLSDRRDRTLVVRFLESINAASEPFK